METMKNYKVNEMVEMVKNGQMVREMYQRTPSHDKKFGQGIIKSLLNGQDINIITLAKTETGKLAILDGSSRLQDIVNFIDGNLTLTETATEIYTNSKGETLEKSTKIERTFAELPETVKSQFMETTVLCRIIEGLDINGRFDKFLQLNNSTSLSNVQKSKGLSSELLETLNDYVLCKPFINKVFSLRNIQKDEIYGLSVLILANVGNVYNASYVKMLDNVKKLTNETIDIDKIKEIVDIINQAFDDETITVSVNKYNLVHLINALYNNYDNLNNITVDNNLFPNIATTGANSSVKNDERQKTVDKALNKQLKGIKKTPAKEMEEIDIDELAK